MTQKVRAKITKSIASFVFFRFPILHPAKLVKRRHFPRFFVAQRVLKYLLQKDLTIYTAHLK